jgi:hypothetical protein
MVLIIRRMTWFCMFGAVALWSVDASAGLKMRTDCQKNRTDGRVIADLGGRSPDEVRFKVLSFEPRPTEAGPWSFGRCLIEITKQGNSRR